MIGFMEQYHPMADLAPRDIVARAIVNESEPALNIAPLISDFSVRFPTIYHHLCDRGFDIETINIPVQPVAHYTVGGIIADIYGVTSLDELYAIGECASTGFHGANRLASNSLLRQG